MVGWSVGLPLAGLVLLAFSLQAISGANCQPGNGVAGDCLWLGLLVTIAVSVLNVGGAVSRRSALNSATHWLLAILAALFSFGALALAFVMGMGCLN